MALHGRSSVVQWVVREVRHGIDWCWRVDEEGSLVVVVVAAAVLGRRTHTVVVADSDCIHTAVAEGSAGHRHCTVVEARRAVVEGTGHTVEEDTAVVAADILEAARHIVVAGEHRNWAGPHCIAGPDSRTLLL